VPLLQAPVIFLDWTRRDIIPVIAPSYAYYPAVYLNGEHHRAVLVATARSFFMLQSWLYSAHKEVMPIRFPRFFFFHPIFNQPNM
jgi:hypothetical protein